MKKLAPLGAILLTAAALAGCGSSSPKPTTSTVTATVAQPPPQTVTQTTTTVAPPTTTSTTTATPKGFASTYPSTFENSFAVSCDQSSGSASICGCVLRHIEASVPYSTVVADDHAIVTGNPPSWYTGAEQTCGA